MTFREIVSTSGLDGAEEGMSYMIEKSPGPNSFARVGSGSLFVEMAYEHYKQFQSQLDLLGAAEGTVVISEEEKLKKSFRLMEVRHELSKRGLIAIVFAACAIESHIYDYADRRLDDGLASKHLEKLSVTDKWVVVPMLVTGTPFPKCENAFQLLGKLVSARNSIMHHKSADFDSDRHSPEWFEQQHAEFIQAVHDSIKALQSISKVCAALDPEDFLFASGLNEWERVEKE